MENKSNNTKSNKNKVKDIKKGSNNRIMIKDKKKFCITIIIVVLIIIFLIIALIALNKKEDISKVEDYSVLDTDKYSRELLDEYNKNESKEKFLSDYDLVQGAVGLYIMNNSTLDNNSFESIIVNLKEILKKEEWSKLDIDIPKYWNGFWSVTDDGIVKFKFGSKDIEPSWINDEELTNKLKFNN